MLAPRAPAVPAAIEEAQASSQSWLSELSAPDALARWASSFADLRSCWNACPEPEWLLWLAARTCCSVEQREQVVLCAAELASAAQRRGRQTDPRVTHAISMVQMWAGSQADGLDMLAAECDALDAARESAQAADREAELALAMFGAAPRRRPSSSGMGPALGAWHRWREVERDRWLALAAASAAAATTLPGEAILTQEEWADCVSQSATFALQAMSTQRPSGGRPGWVAKRRCVRLARRRLTCPQQAGSVPDAAPQHAASVPDSALQQAEAILDSVTKQAGSVPDSVPGQGEAVPYSAPQRGESVLDAVSKQGEALSDSVLQQAASVPDSVTKQAEAVRNLAPQRGESVLDAVSKQGEVVPDPVIKQAEALSDSVFQQAASVLDSAPEQAGSVSVSVSEQAEAVSDSVSQQAEADLDSVPRQAGSVSVSVSKQAEAVSDSVPKQGESVSDSEMASAVIAESTDSPSWWIRRGTPALRKRDDEGNVPSV